MNSGKKRNFGRNCRKQTAAPFRGPSESEGPQNGGRLIFTDMKITFRQRTGIGGRLGSLLNPCTRITNTIRTEHCDSLMDCGGYVVLMRGGFTQHCIDKSDIISTVS